MAEDDARDADDLPAADRSRRLMPSNAWAPPTPRGLPPPDASTAAAAPHIRSGGRWSGGTAAGLPVRAWLVMGVVAIVGIVAGTLMLGGDDREPTLAIDITNLSIPERPRTDSATETHATVSHTGPDPGAEAGPDTVSDRPGGPPGTEPDGGPEVPPERAALGDGSQPTGPLPAGDPDVSTFEYADPFGS